ncbi:MAG TPA: flippase activity-associated protein Agl23, partial [Halococcus sp.]|nr:flippase activity-associated protein Agl23 [Halococcus sp.]
MISRGDTAQHNRRVTLAVVAIALFGLLARLAFLGERIAHWDEARVAYWILHYADTGTFEYQPIIHGPFLQQVNRVVFEVLGANDFTMRLVVALLGAALPLCALLFRNRLRGVETVALALFLAANPVLLYYSRFMRSDLPLAVFMLFALGFFVRALDTRRSWYVHAGVLSLALGFTTKENVLLYLVTWLGALALLADHRLFLERGIPERWRDTLSGISLRIQSVLRVHSERTLTQDGGQMRSQLRRFVPHTVFAIFEFFAIIVFFYAPRTNGETPGFNTLLSEPATFPAVVSEATLGSWNAFYSLWVEGGHQDHAYLPFLGDFLGTLAAGAGALVVLAFVGFLADRYSGEHSRDLVAFCFYWGFVSVLGYPIITDIKAPWVTIHAIVPLAIPAAVGVG